MGNLTVKRKRSSDESHEAAAPYKSERKRKLLIRAPRLNKALSLGDPSNSFGLT